jgi:hypothetical protein
MNTAQLREAAYDAEHSGAYAEAARLYAAAADAYPAARIDSQLARDDIAQLREAARRNASLAKPS